MSANIDFDNLFIKGPGDPLDDPPAHKRRKLKYERAQYLVAFPLAFLATVYQSVEGKVALTLALLIWRRTRVCNSQTVTLSGAELTAVGIDRRRKAEALTQLAAAGIIRMEKNGAGRSAKVTLLRQPSLEEGECPP